MSIYDVIQSAESGGNLTAYNPVNTSSGHAMGLYQITTGTWNDFAPKAGIDLSQYPNANAAPADVQQAVASQIPLSRWAPSTVASVLQAYPGLDTSQTVGALAGGAAGGAASGTSPSTSLGAASPLGGSTSWVDFFIRVATVVVGIAVLIVGLSSLNSGRTVINTVATGTRKLATVAAT